MPPDFHSRLIQAGAASAGQYVLTFFAATDTGVEMFDFRTRVDAPERITVFQGAAVPAPPPDTPASPSDTPTSPPDGEMGLPAGGNGGLADAGSPVARIVWLALLTPAVGLLALAGLGLAGRKR